MRAETSLFNHGRPGSPAVAHFCTANRFGSELRQARGWHRRQRLIAFLLATSVSCLAFAGSKKQGVTHTDEYDAVRIEQMIGNNVSGRVFERIILCLNARRETRKAPAVTSQTVTLVTNINLTTITNQTVTLVTNQSRTLATNFVALPVPPISAPGTNESATAETNQVAAIPASQPPSSTNLSVTAASNVTVSKAGNQIVTTLNSQSLLSRQVTMTTNTLSITTADNQAISGETNQVVITVTNQLITTVTNLSVTQPEEPLQDYFLYTELTPPPDFVLQTGEPLVLLVDGVRHGLLQANSQTAFVSRRGYTSTIYKATPELLMDIANAKQVKIRVKGVNAVIEKEMNRSSRNHFKTFLAKYLSPGRTAPVASIFP